MKKFFKRFLFLLLLLMPVCVNASDYLLCGNDKRFPLSVAQLVSLLFVLIKILVPILFVITGIVSFLKVLLSAKVDDELQKAKQNFINRIIAAFIIFFMVSIVNTALALVAGKNNSFSDCLNCMIHPNYCEQIDDEIAKICPGLVGEQENYDSDCNYVGGRKGGINYSYTGETGVPDYGDNSKSSSSGGATGEYTTWRQGAAEWGGRWYGGYDRKGNRITIANYGCNLTSIAIQIKRSGVSTNVSPFNPGTLFDFMKARGYLGSDGNTNNYYAFNEIAPGFEFDGQKKLTAGDTNAQKVIADLLDNDKYPIVFVKGNNGKPLNTNGHYVAAVGYTGDDIIIVDPASTDCTRLFTCKPGLDRSNGYLIGGEVSYWRVDK